MCIYITNVYVCIYIDIKHNLNDLGIINNDSTDC